MVPSDANPRRDRNERLIGSPMVDGLAAWRDRFIHCEWRSDPRWSCRRSRSLNGKTPQYMFTRT